MFDKGDLSRVIFKDNICDSDDSVTNCCKTENYGRETL